MAHRADFRCGGLNVDLQIMTEPTLREGRDCLALDMELTKACKHSVKSAKSVEAPCFSRVKDELKGMAKQVGCHQVNITQKGRTERHVIGRQTYFV